MKIDGMKAHRESAEAIVNGALYPTTLDLVHAAKRASAQAAVESAEFAAAAEIEGLSPQALRDVILSKPDDIIAKDNKRRRLIVAIRKAKTTAEVDEILSSAGFPTKRPPIPGMI
jgi:hypothetical protein